MKPIIHNPCNENWDAMDPTAKGAFCKVCSKEVIDFSKKTEGEIKSYLTENIQKGEICGRFSSTQVDTPSDLGTFWHQVTYWNRARQIMLAIALVFNGWLFGQNNPKKDNVKPPEYAYPLMGAVAYPVPQDTVKTQKAKGKKKTVKNNPAVKPDCEHETIKMGKVMYVPDEDKKKKNN